MKVQLTIQEKLKDLRVERGLTLEELEAEVNISKSTLGSYENDEYKDISHTSLITLAKYYGVSTDSLTVIRLYKCSFSMSIFSESVFT